MPTEVYVATAVTQVLPFSNLIMWRMAV